MKIGTWRIIDQADKTHPYRIVDADGIPVADVFKMEDIPPDLYESKTTKVAKLLAVMPEMLAVLADLVEHCEGLEEDHYGYNGASRKKGHSSVFYYALYVLAKARGQ